MKREILHKLAVVSLTTFAIGCEAKFDPNKVPPLVGPAANVDAGGGWFSGKGEMVPTTAPSPAVTEDAASARSTAAGRAAPVFSLPDQNAKPVSLADQRGKWVVLYFYPADDTPGCTCQATEFTKLLHEFNGSNAVIMGVSADTPESHRKFARKYDLKFPLLSDVKRDTMREYGAWVDMPKGLGAPGRVIRSTYLINPSGVVAWHWPEVIPQGHAQRVMDKLNALEKT